MMKGLSEPSKYEYRVEMLNYRDPKSTVLREFQSDFEVGECWGYNRFYRIESLEREGFLSDDNVITLKYFIRAPYYPQHCRD
jgi:tripartite motif-containing protein 37